MVWKHSYQFELVVQALLAVYLIFFDNHNSIFFIIMFVLIFYTHRENIKRLKNKEESKTKIY